MLLLANKIVLPFDCYLLRFSPGARIDEHTDLVDDRRHYRLNVVLKQASIGGEFKCSDTIFESNRIKLFRPDISSHSVSLVEQGTRYVLSIGWIRK